MARKASCPEGREAFASNGEAADYATVTSLQR